MTINLVTTLPLIDAGGSPGFVRDYDVSADGSILTLSAFDVDSDEEKLTEDRLILNWFEELRRTRR